MSYRSKNFLKIISLYFLPLFMGVISFFIVVGLGPLNPENIAWLDGGFDPSTHYLAWEFFRETPWSIPLGLNLKYGMEVGSSIVYSDSIPLMAIFFKLFSGYISRPFQYIGIWMLICFILQSYSGWLLMRLTTSNLIILFFSTLFFIYSPVFLWRLGEHAALLGQFLVVFALYLNFCKNNSRRVIYWVALICSSLLIQIYFSPMLVVLWCADLMNRHLIRREMNRSEILKEIALVITLGLVVAWGVGYFVQSGSSALGLDYGYRQLNLLSLVNPGGWSYILPEIPLGNPGFEGFSFLGLGLLMLLPIFFYFCIKKYELLRSWMQKNFYFILALLFFTIFSISHNISVGPFIFHIPLPEFLVKIGGTFRASGRFFWPIYYVLMFCILSSVVLINSRLVAILLLSLACIAQISDTKAGWIQKRQLLNYSYGANWVTSLRNEFWRGALTRYLSLIEIPLIRSTHDIPVGWSNFAYEAALNRMSTNFIYLGRYDESRLAAANLKYELAIASGNYDSTTLYIVDDERVMPVLMHLDANKDLFAKIDNFNVLAPGWAACATCAQPSKDALITKIYPQIKINEVIGFGKGQKGVAFLIGVDQYQIKGWGWAYPEKWGAWSEGSRAKVVLPIPQGNPASLILDFRAFITAAHLSQRVEVFVNNVANQTVIFDKDQENQITIDIGKNAIREYVAIELRLPDAKSPKELGIGDDIRLLGVGLAWAEFR